MQIARTLFKDNPCRYQDIAKLALDVRQKRDVAAAKTHSKSRQKGKDSDVMVQIAQELYRVVLFAVFMAQTFVVGQIPVIGSFTFPSSSPQILTFA